jgi:hypothetical protein
MSQHEVEFWIRGKQKFIFSNCANFMSSIEALHVFEKIVQQKVTGTLCCSSRKLKFVFCIGVSHCVTYVTFSFLHFFQVCKRLTVVWRSFPEIILVTINGIAFFETENTDKRIDDTMTKQQQVLASFQFGFLTSSWPLYRHKKALTCSK